MKTSDTIDQLATALALAQAEFTNPEKNRTVKVQTKTGGSYTFDYATLDSILDLVRGPLTRNGISLIQPADTLPDGTTTLATRLQHASGQYLETCLVVHPAGNDLQSLGSALTYLRRYSLITLLGLAAEEDDDGAHGSGHQSERTERQTNRPNGTQPRKPQKPPPLSEKDANIIKTFADILDEANTEQGLDAVMQMLKQPDSGASKADDPIRVKGLIWESIKAHPNAPGVETLKEWHAALNKKPQATQAA